MTKKEKEKVKAELAHWMDTIQENIVEDGLDAIQWAIQYGAQMSNLISLGNPAIDKIMSDIDDDHRAWEKPLKNQLIWIYYFGQLKAHIDLLEGK